MVRADVVTALIATALMLGQGTGDEMSLRLMRMEEAEKMTATPLVSYSKSIVEAPSSW